MFYYTAKTFSISYVSYEDETVNITTGLLKATLSSFSLLAPHLINDRFGGGIKLQPLVDDIPLICMIDFSDFSMKPRNKYMLVEYTPVYSESHDCDLDLIEWLRLIFQDPDEVTRVWEDVLKDFLTWK